MSHKYGNTQSEILAALANQEGWAIEEFGSSTEWSYYVWKLVVTPADLRLGDIPELIEETAPGFNAAELVGEWLVMEDSAGFITVVPFSARLWDSLQQSWDLFTADEDDYEFDRDDYA